MNYSLYLRRKFFYNHSLITLNLIVMKKITLFLIVLLNAVIVFGQYAITPLWEFSIQKGNLGTAADDVKNGFDISNDGTKLYLSTRATDANQVAIYDATTGVRTGYLPGISGYVSQYGGDVAVDDNGAIYACNVIISSSGILKIVRWANDAATPSTYISTTAHGGDGTKRVGYGMDVKINTEGNGFIVMHKNTTDEFLFWTITNNVPDSQDPITIKATFETGTIITDSYSRISIINDNSFWFDGSGGLARLVAITKSGTAINATPTALTYKTMNSRTDVYYGVGGAAEFNIGGLRHLVFAANNHGTTLTEGHMSRIQRLEPTGVGVSGAVIATLPSAGMGKTTDGSHFVKPIVFVKGNDAYIYLMGGFNGISAFKVTALPMKTFTVTVPEGTEKVYVAGSFTEKNWDATTDPYELTPTQNPNVFAGTFPCGDDIQYKYLCGKDWDYEEGVFDGANDPKRSTNRSYNATDIVPVWYRVNKITFIVTPKAQVINLFVKGSWDGWTTAIEMSPQGGAMVKGLRAPNPTGIVYSANIGGNPGDKFPANTQYKYYTNQIQNENWEVNEDGSQRDNRWAIAPVMKDYIPRFDNTTGLSNTHETARIIRTLTGVQIFTDTEATIEIFNANGVLIEKTNSIGSYNRALNNGLYLIRIDGETTKFIK